MPTVIRRSANRVRSPTKACKHPDPPANKTAKIRANLRPNLSPINPRMKAPEIMCKKRTYMIFVNIHGLLQKLDKNYS